MIINIPSGSGGSGGGGSFIQIYADDPQYIEGKYIEVLKSDDDAIFGNTLPNGVNFIQVEIEETGYYTINVYDEPAELDEGDIIEKKRIYVDSLTTSYSVKIGPDMQNSISYNAAGGFKFFTSSDMFTVPEGVSTILVSGTGGGGGGASGGRGIQVNSYYSGGGGAGGTAASGVYGVDCIVPVKAGESLMITVGAGGVGGAEVKYSSAQYDGNDGEDGFASEISRGRTALISFPGGGGGKKGMKGGGSAESYAGGAGGAGGTSGTVPSNISGITGVFGGKTGETGKTGKGNVGTGGTAKAADDALILGSYRRLFGNAFGCGGSGSNGSDGVYSAKGDGTQSGGNGKNGCILICWGTWKYDDVAQLLKWDEVPNASVIKSIQWGAREISTSGTIITHTAVDIAKSVILVNGDARYSSSYGNCGFAVYISARTSTSFTLTPHGSADNKGYASWQLIEFY